MRVALDTNILVYSVDLADPQKQQRAIEIINRATVAGSAIAEQSYFEFLNVVVRKFGFPRDGSFQMVSTWRSVFDTVWPSDKVFDDTKSLMQRFNLNVWDSHLLAICAAAGISVLLSEDMQDGGLYGTVLVVDPFEPANDTKLDALLPP
ncbi:MAG: PIN domain-containing protein [Micropepsaceae bacterium]